MCHLVYFYELALDIQVKMYPKFNGGKEFQIRWDSLYTFKSAISY